MVKSAWTDEHVPFFTLSRNNSHHYHFSLEEYIILVDATNLKKVEYKNVK